MNLARIACKYADVTVAPTLADGTPASITGVDLALVPPATSPDAATVWAASAYNATTGVASILVAGADFLNPPGGALVCPAIGADVWARVTDTPEVDAAQVGRITVF